MINTVSVGAVKDVNLACAGGSVTRAASFLAIIKFLDIVGLDEVEGSFHIICTG